MLTVEGLQVPAIPLTDVPGSAGTDPPSQITREVPKLNTGVVLEFTFTEKLAEVAHRPAAGENVYVAEAWLSTTEGDHVPEILLADVDGKEGTVPPAQMLSDVPKLNVGVCTGFTVTVKLSGKAH